MSGVTEQLGSVNCPSGKLVILDGGCAWLWSHDRPPVWPRLPMIVGAAESAGNLAVRGPDALVAGRAFARSTNPLFVFDVAGDQVDETCASFAALMAERRLDAAIEVLGARVPHRHRLDLSLEVGHGSGAISFHGMTAIAFGDVPPDRYFPILAETMSYGRGWCWRRVWIEIHRGDVAARRFVGRVSVDEARLMAVDAEALALWDDIESSDGRSDVVFWGPDAERVARETGAEAVDDGTSDGVYGWLDLPVDVAEKRASETLALQSQARRFAVDLRPHTHQWEIMAQVRRTATSSGHLELGGARLCVFHTMLGDGHFPAYAELDASGRTLRAVVELWEDEALDPGAAGP